jgi:hypothetical protein
MCTWRSTTPASGKALPEGRQAVGMSVFFAGVYRDSVAPSVVVAWHLPLSVFSQIDAGTAPAPVPQVPGSPGYRVTCTPRTIFS